MSSRYIPDRGDIVWLNLNPRTGHEQSGLRPALVVSFKVYNKKIGLAIFCPITNQIKQYPFEVLLPSDIKVRGVILSDQIRSLDWRFRQAKFICKLPASLVNEVIGKLNVLLK